MSDAELRNLERAWRGSGAAEDEAAYLRASVRAGELSEEALALRAWLGSVGALAVAGLTPPDAIGPWVAGLSRWGLQCCALAVAAAARATVPVFEERFPDDASAREALDALDGYLDDPERERAFAVARRGAVVANRVVWSALAVRRRVVFAADPGAAAVWDQEIARAVEEGLLPEWGEERANRLVEAMADPTVRAQAQAAVEAARAEARPIEAAVDAIARAAKFPRVLETPSPSGGDPVLAERARSRSLAQAAGRIVERATEAAGIEAVRGAVVVRLSD